MKNLYKIFGGGIYDKYFAPGWFARIYIKYENHLISNKIISDEMTVCDIGCGSGTMLERICHLGIQTENCTGVDPSGIMLKQAKIKLPNAKFINACSHDYEIIQKFDLVYSTISFHHFQNPQKSLQKMINNCKVGGHVIVVDISPLKCTRYSEMLNWIQFIDGGVRCYSENERHDMFIKLGIKKSKISVQTLQSRIIPIKLYHIKC